MSQQVNHGPAVDPIAAADAGVRQLIANGKEKVALDRAKEIHKARRSESSEVLLIEAYAARIQALIRQNLIVEAKSLLDLARERYPSSRPRLDDLMAPAVARTGDLRQLIQPLSDPAVTAERRAAIEQAIHREVWDLQALAECPAIPEDDPLRRAAAALHRAFLAATGGPVEESALALPEVSRRSPLASWKVLLRAIACFYRKEDEACRRNLDLVQADSAAARLVPAIHAMLGDKIRAPLSPASAALVCRTTESSIALHDALEALERALASEEKGRILQATRVAMQECRRTAPGLVDRLTRHIAARSAIAGLAEKKVAEAMGGPIRFDAGFLRLLARGMEDSKILDQLPGACMAWNDFRIQAVKEGWFAENSMEAAAIYLHIAELLRKLPGEMVEALRPRGRNGHADEILQSDTLYRTASQIDPHSEAFAQWLDWAKSEKGGKAQRVAETWHKALPLDMAPILFLLASTEKRGAFPAALKYVAKAERIDSVHPEVRKARLRLMVGNVLRQIQQRKFAAASKDLALVAELPQSRQGDRPAFLAALHHIVSAIGGDTGRAAAYRAEIETLLKDRLAADVLLSAVAAACKTGATEKFGLVERVQWADRPAFPAALARVADLADDMRMPMYMPKPWVSQTRRQLASHRDALDANQLRSIAAAALSAKALDLAYAASSAGLERGSATEARFLLLRARSLPEWHSDRAEVCAVAAAELARRQLDTELVSEAVEFQHGLPDVEGVTLTLDQAAQVLSREKAEPNPPAGFKAGPDYSDILDHGLCQCPNCRRKRGELAGFEDGGEEDDFDFFSDELLKDIPEDMPPEIAKMLLEETRRAVLSGESLDQLTARLMRGALFNEPKRRRRK